MIWKRCSQKFMPPWRSVSEIDPYTSETSPGHSMNRQEGAAMLCSTSSLRQRLVQCLRWFTVATVAALIARLVIAAYHYLDYAIQAIRYPFGLDYGEGIVWQQAVMIPSKSMYGDITKYPYIVFHYPPLYHLVTRVAARAGMDWLTAGRAVSVASTGIAVLAAAALVYAVSSQRFSKFASLSGALIGSLYILTQKAIIEWSPLMRVDMLAIAFSLSGLLLCIWSIRTGACLYLAVFAFVAAVYTKQTALVAAVAGIGPFLVLRPRQAILPMLCGLLVISTALVALSLYTDGGFLRHTVGYNLNPFSAHRAYWSVVSLIRNNASFVGLVSAAGLVVAMLVVAELRTSGLKHMTAYLRSNPFAWGLVTLFTYFVISTPTLATLGKTGAGPNYAIEWLCAGSLLVGLAFAATIHMALQAANFNTAILAPIIVSLIAVALTVHTSPFHGPDEAKLHDVEQQQQLARLISWIRAAPKPVLSDDMVLLMSAGKQVPLEPAIFAELSATGQWDEKLELNLIETEAFEFIVTERNRSSKYTTAAAKAIDLAYPKQEDLADYVIHLPNDTRCELGPPLRCPPEVPFR
jgi:hypothetical protein